MAICENCGKEYSDKRKALGYNTCLDCGEQDAKDLIEERRTRIAPAYNKGPLMYITSKDVVKDLG